MEIIIITHHKKRETKLLSTPAYLIINHHHHHHHHHQIGEGRNVFTLDKHPEESCEVEITEENQTDTPGHLLQYKLLSSLTNCP